MPTHLRTDDELEDGDLLGETLLSQEVGGEVSSGGLALVTGDSSGAGDSSESSDQEQSSVLHHVLSMRV